MKNNKLDGMTTQQFLGLEHRITMHNRAKAALHKTPVDCATWQSRHEYVAKWYTRLQAYKKGLNGDNEQ